MRYENETVVEVIADGLDAAIDGRGYGEEHLKADTLANAAPELLFRARAVVNAFYDGHLAQRIRDLAGVVGMLDAAKVDE